MHRSSQRRCFVRRGVLRDFTKSTEKHLCQSLFFDKVAGSFIRLWHRCFSVNFVKFLGTSFLQNTSGRLLLHAVHNILKSKLRLEELILNLFLSCYYFWNKFIHPRFSCKTDFIKKCVWDWKAIGKSSKVQKQSSGCVL